MTDTVVGTRPIWTDEVVRRHAARYIRRRSG